MSKKRFYREVSFTLLYAITQAILLLLAWGVEGKFLIASSLICSLAIISSLFRMIYIFRDPEDFIKKEEDKDNDG